MNPFFLYLLEVSICLLLFYLVYFLFLRKETFHRLKRIFLIGSLCFALIIPELILSGLPPQPIVTAAHETNTPQEYSDNFEQFLFKESLAIKQQSGNFLWSFQNVLWLLYFSGFGWMFFRFVRNILQVLQLIRNHPQQRFQKYKLVLLPEDYANFSFLGYIFLNPVSLGRNEILLHESTHLKQGHSFDILLLEFYKMVFWFNPLIGYFKRSVVLVHECLADQAILKKNMNMDQYQELLLKEYLSKFSIELAHPFNYSLIKFRIKMMTKNQSKWWTKTKLIFVVPVIFLVLIAFTNRSKTLPANPGGQEVKYSSEKAPIRGWSFNYQHPAQYACSLDASISHHGSKSAFMKSIVDNPAEPSVMVQKMNLESYQGKNIRMTGFIKTEGDLAKAQMWIRVDDVKMKMATDFDNMENRAIKGTQNWTKCEIIFTAPKNGMVFYGVILDGPGKLWFDEVKFEIVDQTVKKTAWQLNSPFPKELLDHMPSVIKENKPLNLDFED